jgi:hypothetical protein
MSSSFAHRGMILDFLPIVAETLVFGRSFLEICQLCECWKGIFLQFGVRIDDNLHMLSCVLGPDMFLRRSR